MKVNLIITIILSKIYNLTFTLFYYFTGIYYKLKDGFNARKSSFTFYLDLISSVPLAFLGSSDVQKNLGISLREANILLKSTKVWKILRWPFTTYNFRTLKTKWNLLSYISTFSFCRLLNYLDNVHPKKVFWFRFMQTFFVLVYGIHFNACIVYMTACPWP